MFEYVRDGDDESGVLSFESDLLLETNLRPTASLRYHVHAKDRINMPVALRILMVVKSSRPDATLCCQAKKVTSFGKLIVP